MRRCPGGEPGAGLTLAPVQQVRGDQDPHTRKSKKESWPASQELRDLLGLGVLGIRWACQRGGVGATVSPIAEPIKGSSQAVYVVKPGPFVIPSTALSLIGTPDAFYVKRSVLPEVAIVQERRGLLNLPLV